MNDILSTKKTKSLIKCDHNKTYIIPKSILKTKILQKFYNLLK